MVDPMILETAQSARKRLRESTARLVPVAFIAALLLSGGCGDSDPGSSVVQVGSTTSLYDTGLLDTLVALFEAENPDLDVRVLAVGTGQALELGRRGDADVLLVHAPEAERAFVAAGHGRDRVTFMQNDFVVAGPGEDPAGVRRIAAEDPAPVALSRIATTGSPFLSRGDDSGTHKREQKIWAAAGIDPSGPWYGETGQGMGSTLVMASERRAYTLTDRATLTVLGEAVDLAVVTSGGSSLENLYSVMLATAGANPEGAVRFWRWLLGEGAQEVIAEYGVERFGSPLFYPLDFEVPGEASAVARAAGSLNPFQRAWHLLVSGDAYLWDVVLRSLAISGSALLLAVVIGLPIGIGLALSRFRFKLPVVAFVNTGLAFPPVVVGLLVYLLLSRRGPLGPLELLYTPAAVILAQVILAGPYIVAVTLAALDSVPPDVRTQARGLGASRWQATLLHLRESRASLVAAVAAGFGAVISEVGAVMIVGGNLLGETRVMTSAIVLETRRGNFGVAVALGIVLLGIALIVNLLLTLLHVRRVRAPALP
jgi:ABC-type tungstate transport system permease subunit/ABC-type tungstate transport system substrate-binding protein